MQLTREALWLKRFNELLEDEGHQVTRLEVLPGRRLALEFSNEFRGVMEYRNEQPGSNPEFNTEGYFEQASLQDGRVVWPDGKEAPVAWLAIRCRRPPMTVAELIVELQTLPQDARVVTAGYEGGFDDVTGVQLEDVVLDAGYYVDPDDRRHYSPRESGMEGEHTTVEDGPDGWLDRQAEVVYLVANRAR